MARKLYLFTGSPGARAAQVTVKALGIKVEEIRLDYSSGEHRSPEYLKLNPLHTVPTLDDNGNVICDSHAISAYLVGKYGQDDSLYPKDLYKRALVDQKLAFDLGVIFPVLKTINFQYMRQEIKSVPPKIVEDIIEAYEFLEKFLEETKWISSDCFTIADIHCVTTLTCLDYYVTIDPKTYPNTADWIKRTLELPCFASDHVGRTAFKDFFDNLKV